MLKLKYLVDNRPLVLKILSRWSYDEDSLDLLDQYRISSNAVYPFLYQGEVRLLRFFPVSEKPKNAGLAEISFLRYLEEAKFSSLRLIPSSHGNDYEIFDEESGSFFASVFSKVPGRRMDEIDPNKENVKAAGRALGELHRLSSLYAPDCKRWSYTEALTFCREIITESNGPSIALAEADFIEKLLNALPRTEDRFGLIHFDFERDNLFYQEETGICHVIDFDDAMYHFFAADVCRAVTDLAIECPDLEERIEEWFLQGYREVRPMTDDELAMFPLFQRFFDLFSYARILRVIEEPTEATPEWMRSLLVHLSDLMAERSSGFGKPLFGMTMRDRSNDDPDFDEEAPSGGLHLLHKSHVIFPVPDLMKTAAFYEDKLGFRAMHDMNTKESRVILTRDDILLILVQSSVNKVFPNRDLYQTTLDAYFTTEEPDLLQAEFMASEVYIVRPIGVSDSSAREFIFADCDGRWIGVGTRIHR